MELFQEGEKMGISAGLGLLSAGASIFGAKKQAKAVDRSTDAQLEASREAQRIIQENTQRARTDAINLFGSGQANRLAGANQGLQLFGQSLPSQLGAIQQGNRSAQETLIAGLPQFQNAILGNPVDFSQFQPSSVNVNTDFFQQQLPEFQTVNQALNPQQAANQPTGIQNPQPRFGFGSRTNEFRRFP